MMEKEKGDGTSVAAILFPLPFTSPLTLSNHFHYCTAAAASI
jgi:hypothetical protein